MSQPKSTKGNEAIIEEFMWQMKGDQHNICGQYVPAFCDKQEKRLRTILAQKDAEVLEAKREGAWIGFHVSAEGFNGEYVRRSVKDEDIWKAIDKLLTLPTNI